VANVQEADAGNYFVVVSNSFGVVTSDDATLTVTAVAPAILAQPVSRTNFTSTSARFAVNAHGSEPLTYQWRWNGSDIAGATNNVYVRGNVHERDAGQYSVQVSNAFGIVLSQEALLTVDSTFVAVAGSYNGLFYETNAVAHHSSGFINFNVSEAGAINGKLLIEGGTNKFTGSFDLNGVADVTVLRTNAIPLAMTLQLDVTNNTGELRGAVSDGVWLSELLADRATFNSSNTTALAGLYTMALPGGDVAEVPFGYGYGLITLNSNGTIKLTGAAGDGATLGQSVPVSASGDWPFYVSLYAGKGSLLGWLHFQDTPTRHITGNVSWIKTAEATNNFYPDGFTNVMAAIGSGYIPPQSGTRALNLTNIVITRSSLATGAVTNLATLGSNNVFAVQSPNPQQLKLTLNAGNGLLSGSFVEPIGRTNLIKGVILQTIRQAAGYFLTTNESGAIILAP
jgi:hypothetical protein